MGFRDYLREDVVQSARGFTWGIELEIGLNHPDIYQTRIDVESEMYERRNQFQFDWKVEIDNECLEIKTEGPNKVEALDRLPSEMGLIVEILAPYRPVSSRECGTHVHIGGLDDREQDGILWLWQADLQPLMKFLTTKERSERIFSGENKYIALVKKFEDYGTVGKYLTLAKREYDTLEFRFFHSTLNGNVARNWVELALNICAVGRQIYAAGGGVHPKEIVRRMGYSAKEFGAMAKAMRGREPFAPVTA